MKKITTLLLALGISFAYAGDGITSKNNNCLDCEPAPAVCADCDTPQAAPCVDCEPAAQAVAPQPTQAKAPASRAEARQAWNDMSKVEKKAAKSAFRNFIEHTPHAAVYRAIKNNIQSLKEHKDIQSQSFIDDPIIRIIVIVLLILIGLALLFAIVD